MDKGISTFGGEEEFMAKRSAGLGAGMRKRAANRAARAYRGPVPLPGDSGAVPPVNKPPVNKQGPVISVSPAHAAVQDALQKMVGGFQKQREVMREQAKDDADKMQDVFGKMANDALNGKPVKDVMDHMLTVFNKKGAIPIDGPEKKLPIKDGHASDDEERENGPHPMPSRKKTKLAVLEKKGGEDKQVVVKKDGDVTTKDRQTGLKMQKTRRIGATVSGGPEIFSAFDFSQLFSPVGLQKIEQEQ